MNGVATESFVVRAETNHRVEMVIGVFDSERDAFEAADRWLPVIRDENGRQWIEIHNGLRRKQYFYEAGEWYADY